MKSQKLMRVIWPAFLAACVLEVVVFAMVDPQSLHWSGHAVPLSRQAVYSLAFFVFWAIGIGSNALTALLGTPPVEVNICGITRGERPEGCPQE